MPSFAIRLTVLLVFTLSMFTVTAVTTPLLSGAYAAGSDTPSPPPDDKKKDKKKSSLVSPVQEAAFLTNYQTAYHAIYDRQDYASAIDQLKALGQDDRADVANLIGYAYRKLGNYQVSQIWYERALKADPNHVRTWQYYGLWQLEQGNREQAEYHLKRVAALCGESCIEYRSLAAALNAVPGTGLSY
jgi:tetratricopeptide (TPR) repeat protein